MRTMNPDDPLTMRFPRTSREAFGTNYYEEKTDHWALGAAVIAAALAFAVIWLRS